MAEYRKKPIVIEAFKLGVDYIPDWFMDAVTKNNVILRCDYKGETSADIETLEGWHHANYGDYIIRGVKGELYPCKADIFHMTYEPVGGQQTNADRIRAMSDEELALFVRAIIRAEDCPAIGCDCDKCFFKEPCFNGSKWNGKEKEWLKQPAEGDVNNG